MFLILFFSKYFFKIQVVQLFNSTDMAIAWKNSHLILSETSDFHIVDNMSVAIHALSMCMLTLFSVDKILLPSYFNYISYNEYLLGKIYKKVN